MPRKTKVFTPENMQIIADLRAKKVPNTTIATILGVSLSALVRAVAKHGLPKKGTRAQPFVVAQYVHQTGAAPISLEEMAAKPKAQTITERRAVAYVQPKTDGEVKPSIVTHEVDVFSDRIQQKYRKNHRTYPKMPALPGGWADLQKADVDFALADLASKGPRHFGYARIGEIQPNPFRLKARVCEFDRDRRAMLEEVEGEIDKVFRKFRTLAGPNTRIEDPEIFKLLSAEALAAYDHLQALMSAARRLRLLKAAITEAAIDLHKAGAAATRATA